MVKNPPAMRRPRFDPWVRIIPWRRAWNSHQDSCLKNLHGQRNLVGYSPCSHKESDTIECLSPVWVNMVTGNFFHLECSNYICPIIESNFEVIFRKTLNIFMESQTLQRRKLLSFIHAHDLQQTESLSLSFQPHEEEKNGEMKLILDY